MRFEDILFGSTVEHTGFANNSLFSSITFNLATLFSHNIESDIESVDEEYVVQNYRSSKLVCLHQKNTEINFGLYIILL